MTEPAEPILNDKGSSLTLRMGWGDSLVGEAGNSIDSPQPGVTTPDLPDQSEAEPGPLPYSSLYVGYQPEDFSFAFFASHRNFRATSSADGYSSTTTAHLFGFGASYSFGKPFLGPHLGGNFRKVLQPSQDLSIGFFRFLVKGGIGVTHVDVDVTRPIPDEPRERASQLSLSIFPFHAEVEATIVALQILQSWRVTLGLDNVFFLQEAAAGRKGSPVGDSRAFQWLIPTLGIEAIWGTPELRLDRPDLLLDDDPSESQSFQAVSGRLKLCPGPLRDTATVLEECKGGESTVEFLLGESSTQWTVGVMSRGEGIMDIGGSFHFGDFSEGMGFKLNQGAGFEINAIRNSEEDSTGAALSMSSRDEIILGGKKGFQIGTGLIHTSSFISSDDPAAASWGLIHTFVLRESFVGKYPRRTSLQYEAANILARSIHSDRMNDIAKDAIRVPGTRDKGRLLLFAFNPLYDIPIILSTQELFERMKSPDSGFSAGLLGLSAAGLGAVGVYQLVRGIQTDDLGQEGQGAALTTGVVHGLPALLSRDKQASVWARYALVGATTLGLTIGGIYLHQKGDDPAVAYRVLSFDISQLIAGAYYLHLRP